MKFEKIKNDLDNFEKFVNIAVSANLEDIDGNRVDVISVIRSYNVIRDFINQHLEKDED
jgi:predicted CoA-binding protein